MQINARQLSGVPRLVRSSVPSKAVWLKIGSVRLQIGSNNCVENEKNKNINWPFNFSLDHSLQVIFESARGLKPKGDHTG